ncbi:MaoC/PaaZ C-terminal domain-containing protein [Noviherbaspirillum sedimenti]|uniref:3-alpha,7-alpha, 12-alpha-trihydroxy-5-beta-cholest-24-enoyl-CoA hydratase n=1 Tax=Noviherbaspirillum sedimenti TaxID=2320865 RepID=A0A3A3GLM7_9BURK|nr:MaoC/PaaZ C-terminal domain-containing protein [Noviherbaspirillum sedimenti]RJG03186.1 3-alpha,7-alpha,12-alpha-trihydroxy-5-beta-cholest-24-enoyl-CoA hydratase [Noviherbaspirillum sedimenti]
MNLKKLLEKNFPPLEHHITPRDSMLYALGIGIGDAPCDPKQLQFTYESGLKVFPSQANVISHPGGWVQDPAVEIDWIKLLHGEQSFEIHAPLQVNKTYVGTFRIIDVIDKGVGKGAMLFMEKQLRDKESNELVSTVTSTYVLRGDGGSGGTTTTAPVPHPIPERAPDTECVLSTLPQAALIYRLSGDYNPIHADPELARKAGFERPILHGLCTLGVATRAVLDTCCDSRPELLRSLKVRYSAPVYPGETIATEVWRDKDIVSFRSRVVERNVVVLNHGHAIVGQA